MIRIAIVFVCFFSPFFSAAQSKDAALKNIRNVMPERLLIHTDRDFHLAGQVIWFKIYVINAEDHKLQSMSRTAYAELIGPDGLPVSQGKVKMINGVGAGSFLLPGSASSGAYELRAYTNWMKNHPSTFYRKRMTVINTQKAFDTSAFVFVDDGGSVVSEKNVAQQSDFKSNARMTVHTDKKTYQQRSPVEIKITRPDAIARSSISVAVYKLNELTKPNGFVQPASPDGVLKIRSDQAVFLPEGNGFTLAAVVKDRNGNPAPNVPLLASLTGKLTDVKYNESDANGLAHFNFKDVYGAGHFLLKADPEFSGKVELQALNSFVVPESIRPLEKGIFSRKFLPTVEEMHNHLVINETFVSQSGKLFHAENKDSISFYGKADVTYRLDDYRRFVTMEEVLREYVREVNVRIRNKNYYLPMFSNQLFAMSDYIQGGKTLDENPPLILIDGVPVSANTLMKYDPLKVQKLELIADRYMVGRIVYDGILSFTTYDGNFEGLELDPEDLIVPENGWQHERKFYIPDYKQLAVKNNRIPDFRELLLWEPHVTINNQDVATVSFFTGDIRGEFIVVVKGITDDGRTINESVRFVVD